jgi:hypothetical protein
MMHYERLHDPRWFDSSGYCRGHVNPDNGLGVYFCIHCQEAPDTAEEKALAAAAAHQSELANAQLLASMEIKRLQAENATLRSSLARKLGRQGGRPRGTLGKLGQKVVGR